MANKMEQVAALFGKKLGEEFVVKYPGGRWYFIFCEQGIASKRIHEDGNGTYDFLSNEILIMLLTGEAEILEDENDGSGSN